MGKVIATLDYSSLESDTKQKLLCCDRKFSQLSKSHVESGLEMGKIIATAHELLVSGKDDGDFSAWVASKSISRQTAYNYMRRWQKFGSCKRLLHGMTQEAAYALASPKVPDSAVKAAERLVEKGETITLDVAKGLLGKPKKPRNPKPSPASATGGSVNTSTPATPNLPTEGTANQAEYGAQGKGAQAGPCPKGGEHQWTADEDRPGKTCCGRCGEPKDEPSGGMTFDPGEWSGGDVKDSLGHAVPKELAQVFEIVAEFQAARAKLTAIKSWMTQRVSHPGAKLLEGSGQRIRTDLDNADSELKFSAPYCPCVYCHNKAPKVANCSACKGLGWIPQPIYDAAPKGMKREKAKG